MTHREEIKFTKMHGIGNDYVYINCLGGEPADPQGLAREMSDRHTGIGGDGVILICPSEVADLKMRMFNADGSEGKMCGNGSRCVAKYAHDRALTAKNRITLETLAGIKVLDLHLGADGLVETVTVDMGVPKAHPQGEGPTDDMLISTRGMGNIIITGVSMGNPHGVVFIDEPLEDEVFFSVGPELECHSMWPDRANIEFAVVRDRRNIDMRVWERGSGETLACGTGACATAVAAITLGLTDRKVTVHLRGGDLEIEWASDGHVMMTGGATMVFDGVYYRQNAPR